MALSKEELAEHKKLLDLYMEAIWPPEKIRPKLDVGYSIDDQTIELYEIRPFWNNPEKILNHPYARSTWVKVKNRWKVYWRRADQKWHAYKPFPEVSTLGDFLRLVEDDEYCCFKG